MITNCIETEKLQSPTLTDSEASEVLASGSGDERDGFWSWPRLTSLLMIVLVIVRLLAMWLIPLNDTTEARYAEIARKMLETGNWVTQLHDYGIPFWAKPPLSSWMSQQHP